MSSMPPPPSPFQTYGPPPDNNLVWGILTTIFCCLPLGVVSIVKAANVNSLWLAGDHMGAYRAAGDAKKFAVWSAVLGGSGYAIYVLMALGGIFTLAQF